MTRILGAARGSIFGQGRGGAADPQENRVGTRPTPTKEINSKIPKMLNRAGPKIRVLPRNPRKSAIQTRIP